MLVEKNKEKRGTRVDEAFLELLRNSHHVEEKLKNPDTAQTEFINIACHEMKTPIQAILTYSELLHNEPEKNKDECIASIFRNALRLQRLSNNMLDITRIQSQTLKLQKERFDISELISCLIDDFRHQIEIAGYEFRDVRLTFKSKGSIFVKADKDGISQVISNLIDNAFKFTKKGEVSITVNEEKEDGLVVVTVNDTGCGIDPKILPKLFTKFATVSFRGTGLGLFISKNIIEIHGGTIFAMNNPDGVGASFTFTLPITSKNNHILKT